MEETNKSILTSPLDYNSLVWQDEKGEVNRHCTTLNIDNLPEEIKKRHQFMFRLGSDMLINFLLIFCDNLYVFFGFVALSILK